MTGEEAERMGLISLSVEDDELEAKSLEIASRLANGAPSALRFTKYPEQLVPHGGPVLRCVRGS